MINLYCTLIHLLWSRAGGGGGGHGGGGFSGGGFSGGSGFHGGGGGVFIGPATPISGSTFFFLLLIVVIVLVIRARQRRGGDSGYKFIEEPSHHKLVREPIVAMAPAEQALLTAKVQTAFLAVQTAWSHKDLPHMRRFISDGVYQRFNAQFTMMNVLGQSNPIAGIEVRSARVVAYSLEGNYEHADVEIVAFAEDQFISEKYPGLDSPGGAEEFTEYWSFMRRRDYKQGLDIYTGVNCPKCGGNLNEKLLDTARCPYCGSYINSGEFDWVLDEIVQENDYGPFSRAAQAASLELPAQLTALYRVFPTFSKHILEDRATNAYMQILIGVVTRNMNTLRRFMTAAAFEKAKNYLMPEHIAYNRLYVADARLIALEEHSPTIKAYVAIEYFTQIVVFKGSGIKLLEEEPVGCFRIVKFTHELGGEIAKGNVFANSCPACGAAQKNNLSPTCEYCGSALNDAKLDWVVEDILTQEEYRLRSRTAKIG